jgi:glycosyltransferase involved in cell wall biosynthesis
VRGITDDIIVCDTGSTDDTRKIAQEAGARMITAEWMGYGKTKNYANSLAKYDWILQLDADEFIDEALKNTLIQLVIENDNNIYKIHRIIYFKGKLIRFGAAKNERVLRLFNRNLVQWNDDLVHESLLFSNAKIILLKGSIIEKNFQNNAQLRNKMKMYAEKCAQKYWLKNVKGAWWKQYLSPIYTFFINYLVRLGFLDGYAGLSNALEIAIYTRNKYVFLYRMEKKKSGN